MTEAIAAIAVTTATRRPEGKVRSAVIGGDSLIVGRHGVAGVRRARGFLGPAVHLEFSYLTLPRFEHPLVLGRDGGLLTCSPDRETGGGAVSTTYIWRR